MRTKIIIFAAGLAMLGVGAASGQAPATGAATPVLPPATNPKLPAGFTAIMDGKTTKGWHVSRSAMHGTTMKVTVVDGAFHLNRFPYGQGGVLLSDKSYKNFELYLEAKPDFHDNSGIFLRSTESAAAYQIELVRPGNTGGMVGEYVRPGEFKDFVEPRNINDLWKDGEWNSMRIRITGHDPHVTVWINDVVLWDRQYLKNGAVAGMDSGMIGLQMHLARGIGSGANVNSGGGMSMATQRFRNIAIKELP